MHDDLVDVGRLVHDRLLHSFGAVFFSVRSDQQAFEAAQHIEEVVLRDIPHVARVQPSVADGLGRSFGILPVTGHYVFAADHDFALFPARHLPARFVHDFQVERNQDFARRAETVPVVFGRIGRDDGRGLRKSVSLKHRNADGVEEPLQLRVEQRASAHEEAQASAEGFAHLAEQHGVEQPDRRPQQDAPALPPAVAVLII